MTRSGHAPLRGPRTSRISTRFRHGDTYKRSETLGTVEVAWSANTALHKARSTVHLGLRRFWGGHFARVSAIGRMFWSWLPILPASPVSTRRGPTTHSPISYLINMYQYILRLYSRVFSGLRDVVTRRAAASRWSGLRRLRFCLYVACRASVSLPFFWRITRVI